MTDPSQIQNEYYAKTATRYDEMHLQQRDEHSLAVALLSGAAHYIGAKSVLDVGAGTGRALRQLGRIRNDLHLVGIEPVAELRAVAISQGVPATHILPGDATRLELEDNSFDIVSAFGVLHHIAEPNTAIKEMLRVARLGVFISDSNNFGQGKFAARFLKQACHALGLWPTLNIIKTRGKGYSISEGDGLYYSYSLFDSLPLLHEHCSSVHILNTVGKPTNIFRQASHVAAFCIK